MRCLLVMIMGVGCAVSVPGLSAEDRPTLETKPGAAPERERTDAPQDEPAAALEKKPDAAQEPGDEDRNESKNSGRWFFYKEIVLSAFYSPEGVIGVPPDDRDEDHFELSPRPPGSYVAVDFVRTFTPDSAANRLLPEALPLSAVNLHPRIVFDRTVTDDGLDALRFAPQDFWVRFSPRDRDRLTLTVGQFVLPYGVNPIQAPRQRFLLPLESTDLGLKWDWGVDVKGPIGEHQWEIAATIGSGEALHSPHLFGASERRSYLLTGRIGTPTYWDSQYGVSFLFGELPVIRGANVAGDVAISRWRTSVDTFHRFGTFLMAGGQLAFGQDGFAGDDEFVGVSGGRTADVFGYRGWIDWVIPAQQNLRLGAQVESVTRDLSTSGSDDTAAIFEVSYSSTTAITWRLDYRVETNRAMGVKNDAIFLTFVYYGS